MTEKHQLLTDQQFEQQFENCTLPPALVTYEAHLRLAYIHVKKHGIKKATITLYKQLTHFNTNFGHILVLSKATIKAFVKLIYDFIKKATTTSFNELLVEFPELKTKIQFYALLTQSKQAEVSIETKQPQNELAGFSVL
ncbi:hypothetical protein UMM65_12900 [Aureibaculum sp. 2210JD6-5]|uniref:hypothetical protein n=1 Tax=Aureibaculum sp. 2210JD6-5 TaxID=3103957 RepID=UPI002AAEE36C|nr:hypothetical protein [Aureibaculum sp. 2210JD6-5]MDY7396142.1 hypothetical protein [Aureibaculum sp. 2210JD6-5]